MVAVVRDFEEQGYLLQGGALDRSACRGPAPKGKPASAYAGLRKGQPIELRVKATVDDPCHPGTSLYELALDGTNPCEGETSGLAADDANLSACEREHFAALRGKALAVPGVWGTRDGRSVFTPSGGRFFSFSCLSGVSAKCMRWGYRPDGDPHQRDLYSACVHAARADYCGDGVSYTCAKTVIDPVDTDGVQRRAADTSREVLEADWDAGGAVCIRYPRTPNCTEGSRSHLLDHLRARCPERLRDDCPDTCPDGKATCALLRTYTLPDQHMDDSNGRCPRTVIEHCPYGDVKP